MFAAPRLQHSRSASSSSKVASYFANHARAAASLSGVGEGRDLLKDPMSVGEHREPRREPGFDLYDDFVADPRRDSALHGRTGIARTASATTDRSTNSSDRVTLHFISERT